MSRHATRTRSLSLVDLELDLEIFNGPFDLLLTLILREEVDLLEVDLAEIVISYIDHLESRGELDLEAATEFLVLIAALLELKSRLMLPGEELEEIELDPAQAAAELVERLLDAHRYRGAGARLAEDLRAQSGYRFRSAPLPESLRRAALREATAIYRPESLAAAVGRLLELPPEVDVRHISVPRVTVAERLAHLRGLLRRGAFNFDEAVSGADRITVAVTVYSLLELYKQGELTWSQSAPFGAIEVRPAARDGAAPDSAALGVAALGSAAA